MKLHLFSFGKLKTAGLRETADHYKKLLRPWNSLEEHELKPISVPDKSPATRTRIQEKESLILLERLQNISSKSLFFLLDEGGKAQPTLEWVRQFRTWENEGIQNLSFCIGSSLGFSQQIRQKSHGSVSFGPQTLSHELARVVLLEQLYRIYSVIKGHPYHNEGA